MTKKTTKSDTTIETAAGPSGRLKRLIDEANRRGGQRGKPRPVATALATIKGPTSSTPAAFPDLKDLGAAWIEHLKAKGAAISTWASYEHDFAVAAGHFGADTDPVTLTPEAVAAFETSDAVMQSRAGRPKAKATILKIRRVLRLALTWAHAGGRLATLPYAPKANPSAA